MEGAVAIIFETEDENQILSLNLLSQPYSVGDVVRLSVSNVNKEMWDVKEIPEAKYEITKIKRLVSVGYSNTKHQFVTFLLTVKPYK